LLKVAAIWKLNLGDPYDSAPLKDDDRSVQTLLSTAYSCFQSACYKTCRFSTLFHGRIAI